MCVSYLWQACDAFECLLHKQLHLEGQVCCTELVRLDDEANALHTTQHGMGGKGRQEFGADSWGAGQSLFQVRTVQTAVGGKACTRC